MREDLAAQIGDDAMPHRAHDGAVEVRKERRQKPDGGKPRHIENKGAEASFLHRDDLVDDRADDGGREKGEHRGEDEKKERRQKQLFVGRDAL